MKILWRVVRDFHAYCRSLINTPTADLHDAATRRSERCALVRSLQQCRSISRRRFFEASAGGKLQITDPDGVWIDVTDE